jgi:hypothetical protein
MLRSSALPSACVIRLVTRLYEALSDRKVHFSRDSEVYLIENGKLLVFAA